MGSMENRYVVYVSMSGMVGTKVCVRTDNKIQMCPYKKKNIKYLFVLSKKLRLQNVSIAYT